MWQWQQRLGLAVIYECVLLGFLVALRLPQVLVTHGCHLFHPTALVASGALFCRRRCRRQVLAAHGLG